MLAGRNEGSGVTGANPMRTALINPIVFRLGAIFAGVTIVASCDTRLPTGPQVVSGSGGTGGSTNTASGNAPSVSIDTPAVGALVNVGDSVLVVMHLRGNKSLKSL